jgi:hypothetical protein
MLVLGRMKGQADAKAEYLDLYLRSETQHVCRDQEEGRFPAFFLWVTRREEVRADCPVLSGGKVASAGLIVVRRGVIKSLNPHSGHYRSSIEVSNPFNRLIPALPGFHRSIGG